MEDFSLDNSICPLLHRFGHAIQQNPAVYRRCCTFSKLWDRVVLIDETVMQGRQKMQEMCKRMRQRGGQCTRTEYGVRQRSSEAGAHNEQACHNQPARHNSRAKHSIPDDENTPEVLVQTAVMVHAMVRGSGKDPLDGSQSSHKARVHPELHGAASENENA